MYTYIIIYKVPSLIVLWLLAAWVLSGLLERKRRISIPFLQRLAETVSCSCQERWVSSWEPFRWYLAFSLRLGTSKCFRTECCLRNLPCGIRAAFIPSPNFDLVAVFVLFLSEILLHLYALISYPNLGFMGLIWSKCLKQKTRPLAGFLQWATFGDLRMSRGQFNSNPRLGSTIQNILPSSGVFS